MNAAELMGRNEYARHQRCTPNAVSKAEKDGRIAAAVKRDAAGNLVGIDWRLADYLWDKNTDPAQLLRRSAAPERVASLARPDVRTGGEVAALARAIGLARVDWIADGAAAGFIGTREITAADLVRLSELFINLLARRIEAAIGLEHGQALRRLVLEDEARGIESVEQALQLARTTMLSRLPT